MLTARKTITLVMAAIGVALVVRGFMGGPWPLSVQLVAGILLLAFAALRWRFII